MKQVWVAGEDLLDVFRIANDRPSALVGDPKGERVAVAGAASTQDALGAAEPKHRLHGARKRWPGGEIAVAHARHAASNRGGVQEACPIRRAAAAETAWRIEFRGRAE